MSTNSDPQDQAALAWMARRHSGAWSARDQRRWRVWMDADPTHAQAWQRVQGAWDELGGLPGVADTEWPAARQPRTWPGWRWLAVPTGAVAALLVVWLVLPPGSFAPAQIQRTAVGEQRTLTLPDGSNLELNTNSIVRIDYGLFCRCIEVLWGQAYFNVSHDDPRALRVTAGAGVLHDLGTTFVVRAEKRRTQVGVLKGAVQVRTGQFRHVLHADEVLVYDHRGAPRDAGHRQAADLAAWRHGELVFRDTPLPEALREFARYRRLPLVLDPRLNRIHINGGYPARDLPRFLRMLEQAYPLKVRLGDVLRIEVRG